MKTSIEIDNQALQTIHKLVVEQVVNELLKNIRDTITPKVAEAIMFTLTYIPENMTNRLVVEIRKR